MKKLNPIARKLFPIMGSALAAIAVTLIVKPASIFGFYQPKASKYIK